MQNKMVCAVLKQILLDKYIVYIQARLPHLVSEYWSFMMTKIECMVLYSVSPESMLASSGTAPIPLLGTSRKEGCCSESHERG